MSDRFNPQVLIGAGPDMVARRIGHPARQEHPLAQQATLSELAVACARLSNAHGAKTKPAQGVMALGINTGSFPRLISEGLQALVARSYEAKAEHLKFSSIVPVEKLGEPIEHLGSLDPNIELLPTSELSEIERFLAPKPAAGVSDVILRTFARIVTISRQAIVNDDLRSLATFVAQLGVSGARLESRFVVAALEANPDMTDGEPTFDAALGNVLASAFSADTLGQAMALLRKQALPGGERSDLSGRHLVVSADLEMAARTAVLDAGLNTEVTVMAELPDTRWYLLCDPAIQPVVGVLRLFGTANPTLVEPASRAALKGFDGTGVRVRADLGAVLLSRTGVVRGGV